MKKLFVVFLVCVVMTANVANAAMLRVSEMDVQKFIHSITDIIYTDDYQKKLPLIMTNASKFENTEMPEIGSTAWACQYGLKTSSAPDGEIIFFTDGDEKVAALKVVGYSEQAAENAGALLFAAMQAVGISSADSEVLVSTLNAGEMLASSAIWSKERNCCFVLMLGARPQSAEGFQFVLVASDKQN